MTRRAPHVLYISYDGVLEPLGESQVVTYLERLALTHAITLLSFEKPADLRERARMDGMRRRLTACGVGWIPQRYHKRPPVLSTLWDVCAGVRTARAACRRDAVSLIHARSYVPALMALGARGASGARFLFDMRGFWVDEKVEAGHWAPDGVLYRVGKWWEQRFLRAADAIVSLTHAGVRSLPELGFTPPPSVPVEVIPTCVDLQRFMPGAKDEALTRSLGLADACVIGCSGTVSNWYMRAEMLQYLSLLVRSVEKAVILFVTREDHQALRRDAEAAGIPRDRLVLTRADYGDMPRLTRLFDLGVFFIRPALSKRGSAATKLAEFLASGVPVVINDGVGDSGTIVRQRQVGLVLSAAAPAAFGPSLPAVRSLLSDPDAAVRCRRVAAELFDVEAGVHQYRRLYERLAGPPGP